MDSVRADAPTIDLPNRFREVQARPFDPRRSDDANSSLSNQPSSLFPRHLTVVVGPNRSRSLNLSLSLGGALLRQALVAYGAASGG